MSPLTCDEQRQPLSPVAEPNGLSEAPPALELPDGLKGGDAHAVAGAALAGTSRATPTPTTLPDGSDSDTLPYESPAYVITPIQVPPAESVVVTGPATVDTASTMSPESERDWDASSSPEAEREDKDSATDKDSVCLPFSCAEVEAEDDAQETREDEDAVMALLSLQRVPSTVDVERTASLSDLSRVSSIGDFSGTASASPRRERAGDKRRASSPFEYGYGTGSRHSPVPKLAVDGDSRYFCRYPNCGKGYASTDAVRKHCRQRHLEWLRRLGHGCPALYCRWGDGIEH